MNLIFTLDYEIHGNGDGSPYELMVEPTYRLMDLLEKYNGKLTILADVAEILCFKRYYEETGEDKFYYKDIESQLIDAIRRGHDVQLHIHSSYFKAKFNGLSWEQCWAEYNMAALSYDRIYEMVSTSKRFLEDLLQPVSSDYSCTAFRAANWSMMPTPNIYNALVSNGIKIDTSVYKGGCQTGNVNYDYSNAHSQLHSYPADQHNINLYDSNGLLTEYPIYTEMRYFWSFVTPIRVFRMVRAKFHKHKKNDVVAPQESKKNTSTLRITSFFKKSPWKLDFNQASGYQLINAVKRIHKHIHEKDPENEVVLIGHSKTFVKYNERTLEQFLKWTKMNRSVKIGLFPKHVKL